MAKLFLFIFIAYFFQTNILYAYLDPGTGSFILQALIGGIAAFFTTIVLYWKKAKSFLINLFKKKNDKEFEEKEKN